MLALIHGAFLTTTWLVIKRQSAQIVVRCVWTLTCPTWKAKTFSPQEATLHMLHWSHMSCVSYILKPLWLSSRCKKLQSGLKADPIMRCKGSRLTTDLESDYSHKGSIRVGVTISDVSVVRSKLHWILLITVTHLSISAPFHLLKKALGLGWSVQWSVWKCLFLVERLVILPLNWLVYFQH